MLIRRIDKEITLNRPRNLPRPLAAIKNKTVRNLFLLLTFSTLLFRLSNSVNAQGFEGKIVYQKAIENANPEKITEKEFKAYFVNPLATSVLYIRQNQYKLATHYGNKKKLHTIDYYNPNSRCAIRFMNWENKIYQEYNIEEYFQRSMPVTENINDTINVLGHKCHSITITTSIKPFRTTTVYFSRDYKLDTKYLKNDSYRFLKYIYECGALPLKIIKSGKDVFYNEVFTAVKVSKESLKDKIFKQPKLKRYLKITSLEIMNE